MSPLTPELSRIPNGFSLHTINSVKILGLGKIIFVSGDDLQKGVSSIIASLCSRDDLADVVLWLLPRLLGTTAQC